MRIVLHINSGVCKCGCSWKDHHLGMIMRQDVTIAIKLHYDKYFSHRQWDGVNGYPLYVPEECEHFGFNEMGGKGPNGKDHCYQYEDKDGPLAIIEG